jgi:hypothetical protein
LAERQGIQDGKITNVFVLKDPANEAADYEALDPAKTYTVMTTDYQGKIAAGYKDISAKASASNNTNLIINDVMVDFIKNNSPVGGQAGRPGGSRDAGQPPARTAAIARHGRRARGAAGPAGAAGPGGRLRGPAAATAGARRVICGERRGGNG